MKSKSSVLVLAIILLGCASCTRGSDTCKAITAIAGDTKKMTYAKEWIASRLSNPEFLKSIQRRSTLEYGDERVPKFGHLDWRYLGYEEQFASLKFHMGVTESGRWDLAEVHSASLRQGRSFIIIKLSAESHLGLFWPPQDFAKLRAVGENVFVYCADGN